MRLSPLPAVIACAVLTAGPAYAQGPAKPGAAKPAEQAAELDDDRARAHYLAGESHFAAERWADAAREFTRAYALSRRPEMLINLSRAHERDNALREAIADLELLLSLYPETSYKLEAEMRIVSMRAKLENEPPAEPEPVVLPPVEEEPVDQSGLVRVEEAPAPKPSVWPPHLPTLIVGSAAIAAGAVALGTGLRAHGIHGDLADQCPGGSCEGAFESDRDKGRALARASTGLTFASIALAGATAAMWVLDVKHDRRTLQAGVQGAGAAMRVRF